LNDLATVVVVWGTHVLYTDKKDFENGPEPRPNIDNAVYIISFKHISVTR